VDEDSDFQLSLTSESDVPRDMWKESLSGSVKLVQCEGSADWTKPHDSRHCYAGVDKPSATELM